MRSKNTLGTDQNSWLVGVIGPLVRVSLLSGAKAVRWRPHLAGTRQYITSSCTYWQSSSLHLFKLWSQWYQPFQYKRYSNPLTCIPINRSPSVWGYRRGSLLFSCQDIQWLINSRFCPEFCTHLKANEIPQPWHTTKLLARLCYEKSASGVLLGPQKTWHLIKARLLTQALCIPDKVAMISTCFQGNL